MISFLPNLFLMTALVTIALGAEDSSSFVKKQHKRILKKKSKASWTGLTPKTPKSSKGTADQCDGFPTVSSLDLERYAGRWYLIYGTDSPTIQKRCTAANYVYNPPNPIFGGPPTVGIVNSGFCSPGEICPPPFGQYYAITGTGMPNPGFQDEPGKFLVTLQNAPGVSVTFNYWVIDVVSDPDDDTAPYRFAALAGPYYTGGALTYVLSRDTTVDPSDEETVAALLGKVESAGIPLNNIVPIVQEDVCVYE
jgi:lipocalin